MNYRFLIVSAFTVGLAITLISGLVDTTPSGILGATWHGWPLAWLYVIVYPSYPWTIDWMNFAGDIVIWFVVSFALLVTLLTLHKKKE